MDVIPTKLPGVLLIKPKIFGDERGFFYESFQQEQYRTVGLTLPFVQDNHSRSRQGVLRGLHYQRKHAQGKLVMVTRGAVFDVAVDIRPNSPQFGQWVGEVISDENHYQLYIPPGFAHGFYVLSEVADFCYKCTDYYHSEYEAGIIWNDPSINIAWPITGQPELSAKDQKSPTLAQIEKDHLPEYEI